ncbi:MAG: thioredoxin domain-containing protein, partial [Pseudolysinimonas sp.]
ESGGLGSSAQGWAPKFPNTPVISFLLARGAVGDQAAEEFARRTLATLAASGLRDPVEGGFFRYATMRDWTEPHYERMAYDNAQLLAAYAAVGDEATASGIVDFLLDVLRLPGGAFASAQDSESVIDGARSEGGYYALDAAGRGGLAPPALDEKVLTGLNGMVIGALAEAGARFGRGQWVDAARTAADQVLRLHGSDASLVRASLGGELSSGKATLEDLGGFAGGLLRLALAAGEVRYASIARVLVEACRGADGDIAAPAGADPVLAARGLATEGDPGDGALPSGRSLLADAALLLSSLTADDAHRQLAVDALAPALGIATQQPSGFGAALAVASRLEAPLEQLVVVAPQGAGSELARAASGWRRGVLAAVTPDQAAEFAAAGFELFAGRVLRDGAPAAYYCEHFVCALPVTTVPELTALITRS